MEIDYFNALYGTLKAVLIYAVIIKVIYLIIDFIKSIRRA